MVDQLRNNYLPNLYGLRAILALTVLISHIELSRAIELNGVNLYTPFVLLGDIAVTLFFVLSGFLISYNAFREHIATNSFSTKNFYIRRFLRIWPLYILTLTIGFLASYQTVNSETIVWSLAMLPNIPVVLQTMPGVLIPTWSIGIEEQFYLLFPLLFLIKPTKQIFWMISLIVILVFIRNMLIPFRSIPECSILYDYFYYFRFDTLLIGVIAAHLHLFRGSKIITALKKRWVELTAFVLLILFVLLTIFRFIHPFHEVIAILFVILLINLSLKNKPLFTLEFPILHTIGKWSYSLYLLHKFVLYGMLHFINYTNSLYHNLILYLFVPAIALAVAYLSYRFIETPFLTIKKRFKTKEI